MSISVYIDSCAWNYLYNNKINLEIELPPNEFSIFITSEVEIELHAIPNTGSDETDKRELKTYINNSINKYPVATSAVFGFMTVEPDGAPSPVQVHGGFGSGAFQSNEERNFYERPEVAKQLHSGKKSNSGLGKNEADASLAAKSFSSFVLTNERIKKPGPLRTASQLGGKVIYLEDEIKPTGKKIGDYLLSIIE